MSIEKQIEILNSLIQIMQNSTHGSYEGMMCEFKFETYNGGWSVDSKFSFVRNGSHVSEWLDDPTDEVSSLVHELHEIMKSHTGGDWKQFVLTLDAAGSVQTKFVY